MATDQHPAADGGYVPDPERETAALVDAFFDHISTTARERGLSAGLVAAMRERHAELESANAHLIVDEPARHNLTMTLALVAAYESLAPRLGREAAIEEIRTAFVTPFAEIVRESTRATLDGAPDPFRAMVAVSKSREEFAFGAGFTFRRPADDDRRYLVEVRRCFYHDVLVANSAPELTPVMCAFDANWIEAIDPDRDGFRFERTTTIGLGGSSCPFHFFRTGSGEPASGTARGAGPATGAPGGEEPRAGTSGDEAPGTGRSGRAGPGAGEPDGAGHGAG